MNRCSVCQALLDDEDLFCPNCGVEAPRAEGAKPPPTQVSTHNFACASCGASMSYDASAGALRCPFCGSVHLDKQADKPAIAAELVVPFEVSRGKAIEIMRAWLGRGFWRPNDLSERAAVVSMTAVYVPYWVFTASAHTYWTADTSDVPATASGDWRPVTGEHQGEHSGVLVGASGALRADETARLLPFELASAVPPNQVDLDNVIVEQFSLPRKYARPLAKSAIDEAESVACRVERAPGKCRNMKVNVRATGLSSQGMLAPVWMMAYRYDRRVYRFLINGQTGRATGLAPTSWRKQAIAVGLALLAALLIILAAGLL